MIEGTELHDYAFELATRLNEEYGPDATLGDIIIVAEISLSDGGHRTETLSSESRRHVAKAILDRASDILAVGIERELDPDLEDGDEID